MGFLVFKISVGSQEPRWVRLPSIPALEAELKRTWYRNLIWVLLIGQLLLAGCAALPVEAPTADPTQTRPVASAVSTPELTQAPLPTETRAVPTIAITDKLLKGLSITVRHPFYDSSEQFDQMIRDFNVSNRWGIHVAGVPSGGVSGVANHVFDGLLEDQLVIGMGTDLLAAQPDTQFLALDDYARDPKFGVSAHFQADSPFAAFYPSFGESVHYTIPLAYNAGILLYNTTWAQELGFDSLPVTREDLMSVAETALNLNLVDGNYNNNGTGGLWLSQEPLSAQSWYISFEGEFVEQEGNFTPQPEPLLASFNFLKTAYGLNQTWRGVEPLPYRYFSDRYAVAYEGSLLSLPFQLAYQRSGNFKDDWTALAYPNAAGETFLVLEPLSFAVPRTDPNSELAAWIFASWLMEPDQQARLAEIHGLWPSIGHPVEVAPEYAREHPYWTAALLGEPGITVVPENSDWASVRLVFQDAYQRVYNLDSAYFNSILEVFGETTRINLEQRP